MRSKERKKSGEDLPCLRMDILPDYHERFIKPAKGGDSPRSDGEYLISSNKCSELTGRTGCSFSRDYYFEVKNGKVVNTRWVDSGFCPKFH